MNTPSSLDNSATTALATLPATYPGAPTTGNPESARPGDNATWRTVPTVTGTTIGQPILVSWPKGSAMVSVDDAHWASGAESDAISALLPNQQNAGLLVVSVKYQQVTG